jgi:hypothetical protein
MPTIGSIYASAMRYTLAGAHNASYASFESPGKDIVQIAFKMKTCHKNATANDFTAELLSAGISNPSLHSTTYQAIPTAKCPRKPISTRSWNRL